MSTKNNKIQTTGRRKTAVARVTISKGNGDIKINNKDLNVYLRNQLLVLKLKEPILISQNENKFDLKINVFGGGQNSQIDAIRQAIARGIVEITKQEDIRKKFLDYDRSLLVSDTRFKEMKKPNNSNARAKRQKSYR